MRCWRQQEINTTYIKIRMNINDTNRIKITQNIVDLHDIDKHIK